jgi:hypothetical protein
MAEQILDVPCSKGASTAKEMNCFEKARLAGSVRAKQVVAVGSQVDIDVDETADGANPDALQWH